MAARAKIECFSRIPEEPELPAILASRPLVVEPEQKGARQKVVTAPLKPALAFERFAGKLFTATEGKDGASSRAEFSRLPPGERAFESPVDRFNRLQAEIEQFKADLQTLVNQVTPAVRGVSADDPLAALSNELSKNLVELEAQLRDVVSDPKVKALLQPSAALDAAALAQRDAMAKLLFELAQLRTGCAAETGAAKGKQEAKAPASGAVYELYLPHERTAAGSAAATTATPDLAALDKRIAALEKSIGTPGDAAPGFPDISTALRMLNRKIELLCNESHMDATLRRAKALSAELMALEQQRAKAVGRASPHEAKVNELYNMMHRWDKAAQMLPTVVARLQSLREVHEEAASVLSRLAQLEQQHDALERILKQDTEALQKLSESVAANAATMQKNLTALEQRFAALEHKLGASGKAARKH